MAHCSTFSKMKNIRKIKVFTEKQKQQLSGVLPNGGQREMNGILKLMLCKNRLYLKRQNVTNQDFIGKRKTEKLVTK